MRIICTIYLAVALLVGFTACEMNEELKKNPNTSSEIGRLALDLSVKNNTKAANDPLDFPVVIINKETGETAKSFDSYADLLDHSPVELPVGTYTIKANTPGEFKTVMSTPFFGGEADVVILKNASTEANIVCKIQNVKFGLTLTPEFTTTFNSYAITITCGTIIHDLVESTKGNFEPVYFNVRENTSLINMKVIATTTEGVHVDYDVPLTKGSAGGGGSSLFFEGGDALNVTLKPTLEVDPEDPEPEVSGVGVKVMVAFTFSESEETIFVEVEGQKPDEPGNPNPDPTPNENDLAMSCQYFSNGIRFKSFEDMTEAGDDVPSTVDVEISAKNKIEHLYVTITTNSADFIEALALAQLDKKFDMTALNSDQASLFDALELSYAGIKGSDNYTFSIGKFMLMLGMYPGEHTFTIQVVDANGLSLQKQLVVTATK